MTDDARANPDPRTMPPRDGGGVGDARAEREVRLLASLSLLIGDATDFDAALFGAMQHICAVTGWDYAEAWVPGAAGERLVRSPVWFGTSSGLAALAAASSELTFAPGEGLPGRVWSERCAVRVAGHEDVGRLRRADLVLSVDLRSAAGIPVKVGAEVVAVLAFFSRIEGAADERTVEIVSAAAGQLGALMERKRAEAALRESEERLRAAIDGTLDGFFILRAVRDENGRVVDFVVVDLNRRGAAMLRADRDALVGTPLFSRHEWLRDAGQLERWASVMEQRRPVEEEQAVTTAAGARVWLRQQVIPLADGVAVTARDVTERRRVDAALEEERNFLRTLLEQLTEGIVACDETGRVTLVNRASRELLPAALFAAHEAGAPLPLLEADGVTQVAPRQGPLSRALRGELVRNEELVVQPEQGERRTLRVSGVPIPAADGALQGAVAVISDITAQKRTEASLRELLLVDELTGLYNRRGFLTLAGQQLKVARRTRRRLHLLYVDLDGFKAINDTYGHREGDAALASAAGVLRGGFRDSDIIARIGGDEFVVLTVEGSEATPTAVIGRLLDSLQTYNRKSDRPYALSFSVGVAEFDPNAPVALDQLLAKADEAQYRNKRGKEQRIRRVL